MRITAGDTVSALGRDWTAVTTPEAGIDAFVADPHLTSEERARITRTEHINNEKNRCIPHSIYTQRSVLDVSEVTSVTPV